MLKIQLLKISQKQRKLNSEKYWNMGDKTYFDKQYSS